MQVLLFLGLIAISAGQALLAGYVFSILWGWFIVPTFGIAALSIAQALGVSLTFSYISSAKPDDDSTKSSEDRLISAISWTITKAAMAISIGWIVKSFI